MPLTGPESYLTTADEFLTHWDNVNADRLAATLTPLLLTGNYAVADLTADRDELQIAISSLQGLENTRELAVGGRDALKDGLRDRLSQFRAAIDLHLKQTPYAASAPLLPTTNSAENKFLRPLDDMLNLWGTINADAGLSGFTRPLLLRAGYTLAAFTAEVAEMRERFQAVTKAEGNLSLGRRRRDDLLPPIRERLNQYQAAMALEYGPGHPLFESLPRLYAADNSGGGEGEGGGSGIPAVPGTPILTVQNHSTIFADWADVAGATGFRIWRLVVGSGLDYSDVGTASTSQATISNLPPGETVRIRISAFNNAGESAPGPHSEIVMPEAP